VGKKKVLVQKSAEKFKKKTAQQVVCFVSFVSRVTHKSNQIIVFLISFSSSLSLSLRSSLEQQNRFIVL